MVVRIGSNVASLQAQRRLSDGSFALSKTLERLSSGQRINRASDDAAGLALASSLKTDARVFNQAVRNVNDGISMANIAEGALSAMGAIVFRQKELATQAANGAYTIAQRRAVNEEANTLVDEYNRIVNSAEFNGTKLFGNNPQGVRIQAGQGSDGSLILTLDEKLSRNAGDGTFQDAQILAPGGSPVEVISRDLNGDGKADLISAGGNTDTVSVLIGNGDGTFHAAHSFDGGLIVSSVTTFDFNGDGKTDLATADGGDDTVSVLLGNGDGTFQARQVFSTGEGPSLVVSADLNGDGKDDLVTADEAGGTVSVLLGNQDGTFQSRQTFSSGSLPRWAACGDFNGDGKIDLVTVDNGDGTVSMLIGNGDGTFQARRTFFAGGDVYGAAVGDFNGDGMLDLVTADGNDDTSSVLLGNGDGSFQSLTILDDSSGAAVYAVGVGDFNGDGIDDIAATRAIHPFTAGFVDIFIGNGDGSFQSALTSEVGFFPVAVTISDLNGDGRQDVTTGDYYNGGTLSVLLGDGPRVLTTPYLNLNTRQGALSAMSLLDTNLGRIESQLGSIGAATSRFTAALSILHTQTQNAVAAASRIMDADIAQETAHLVKNEILQQAASAVLAQANQEPALAIRLLQN